MNTREMRALGAALVFLALLVPAAMAAPGNNGTLKIHEQGTPVGTENNDPKVCVFNVEGFGFDAGQTGYLVFTVQGGDGPTGVGAGPFAWGPADAAGFYATQYFNLAPGHYKATLYGKTTPAGTFEDEKAKSKVFKVECAPPNPTPTAIPSATATPTPRGTPTPSPTPTPTPRQPGATPTSTPNTPTPTPSPTTPARTPSATPTPTVALSATPTPPTPLRPTQPPPVLRPTLPPTDTTSGPVGTLSVPFLWVVLIVITAAVAIFLLRR